MKLSVRESGFREPVADHPLIDWSLPRIKELGYDGVELCMTATRVGRPRTSGRGAWYAEYDAEGRARLVDKAASLSLQIPTLSSDWAWGYADFNPDLSMWDRGVEILAEDAKFAHDVGARSILIHFGTSTGTWSQAQRLLTRAAEHAAKQNVVFGFEGSIWFRTGLGGQDTLCKMVDDIGSPNLQIYVHPQRDTDQQVKDIREAGKRICALHSSALSDGIDYKRVFAALKEVGYDWYWCLEVGGDLIVDSVAKWHKIARESGVA
ncbi:MAG: sugar phosphate isomerase/epimerase [Chloroflexota bacterium]|nr:MAG: sugar phosphate isomerase/epimerase [Chloroflexota bacterium]